MRFALSTVIQHRYECVTPCYNGPKCNGNQPITDMKCWSLQTISSHLLYWGSTVFASLFAPATPNLLPPRGSYPSIKTKVPAARLKSQSQSSNPSLKAQIQLRGSISALRLKSQPQDTYPSLKAQIPASRLKFQPQGSNPSLKAQIPALRLKSQPCGSNISSGL